MKLTRRTFVAASTAGVVGVAGCLGGNGFTLEGESPLPAPVAGDPDADLTVKVFEDFACPACAQFKLQLYPQLERSYVEPGAIRYEHHDFPIPVDEQWSWAIAGAARSVQEQGGDEEFWSFTGEVYRHQNDYSYDVVESVAAEVGVDGDRARNDAEDGTYRSALEAAADRAGDAGVQGTPTVVVDGQIVDSDPASIMDAIEDAL